MKVGTKHGIRSERLFAERVSGVRLILAAANIPVVLLDHSVPRQESLSALLYALAAAGLFLVYAAVSRIVLIRDWMELPRHQFYSSFLDVLMAATLVMTTDGYLSPFNVWFIFAVVASGFSLSPKLPLFTALLSLIAHSSIALLPQAIPLEASTFVVRTGYLFGFAAIVAMLASQLTQSGAILSIVDSFGARLTDAVTLSQARRIYEQAVLEHVGADQVRTRVGDEIAPELDQERCQELPIRSGSYLLGHCYICRKEPLSKTEAELVDVLGERLCSAVRRLLLAEELVKEAARAERAKLADQLHDGFLQTLAAIGMQSETALRTLESNRAASKESLKEVKAMVKDAALEVRAYLDEEQEEWRPGPRSLHEILLQRWQGRLSVQIPSDVHLTEGQWRSLELMAIEGSSNAFRHGKAKSGTYSLEVLDGQALAKLICDGSSPPENPDFGYGLGRLEAAVRTNGGQMKLRPGELGGSELVVQFEAKK